MYSAPFLQFQKYANILARSQSITPSDSDENQQIPPYWRPFCYPSEFNSILEWPLNCPNPPFPVLKPTFPLPIPKKPKCQIQCLLQSTQEHANQTPNPESNLKRTREEEISSSPPETTSPSLAKSQLPPGSLPSDPPPSAFLGPKCALWDCLRPAKGDYCSDLHSNMAGLEGTSGRAPVVRPWGIELKDPLLLAALRARLAGKSVGIPDCEKSATAKAPWTAPGEK